MRGARVVDYRKSGEIKRTELRQMAGRQEATDRARPTEGTDGR